MIEKSQRLFAPEVETDRWKRIWHIDRESQRLKMVPFTAPVYMVQQVAALESITAQVRAMYETLSDKLETDDQRRVLDGVRRDLEAWEERLDGYGDALEAVPEGKDKDPLAVERTVIAPLFFNAKWNPELNDGSGGYDPQPGVSDIHTIYMIANQIQVQDDFVSKSFSIEQFGQDILDSVREGAEVAWKTASTTAHFIHETADEAAQFVIETSPATQIWDLANGELPRVLKKSQFGLGALLGVGLAVGAFIYLRKGR